MNKSSATVIALLLVAFMEPLGFLEGLHAQEASPALGNSQGSDQFPAMDILSEDEWQEVDASVDRALLWLASNQQRNGSFPTLPQGQPGVTSLCVLAFLSHGHLPDEGPYGQQLTKAIKYIQSCQKRNGLLAVVARQGSLMDRNAREFGGSEVYNHTISSLLLSEVFSMEGSDQANLLQPIIESSLQASLLMLNWPRREVDRGGLRYLAPHGSAHGDADLSLTGWQLMFLRSAKNAGFDVEQKPIDEAIVYIRRCFNPEYGTFEYSIGAGDTRTRAMAGAGVLALAHAGFHNSTEAQKAGQWILRHPFDQYNKTSNTRDGHSDRYHYSLFNCCQATYQLGGRYWEQFFPRTARTLLANQRVNGSWPVDSHPSERKYGNAYTTALVVLALGAPNQLLPVFQR